jgi:hypothetical protein
MDLTYHLVNEISSFFATPYNCRGYDPNTPIGEIAKHAYVHWENVERSLVYLKNDIQRLSQGSNILRDKIRSLESTLQEEKKDCCRIKYAQKYKRCLLYAKNHKNMGDLAMDAVRLIGLNAYAFTKETETASVAYWNRIRDCHYRHHDEWLKIADRFKELMEL